jgi:hypothetical protein
MTDRRQSVSGKSMEWSAGLGVIIFGVIACPALAQSASGGVIYRMTDRSTFQEGCFAPCMCPILEQCPVIGTFKLTHTGSNGGFEFYAVDDVNWTAAYSDPEIRTTGSGTYTIGSPGLLTVVQHRLELDLKIGDNPVEHFDSGWVIGPNLPHINITISMHNMYCYDRVFVVDADPVPASQIQPYQLVKGSTYERGCYDPCDCLPPGPPQPVVGMFSLVPLYDNSLFAEYAMVGLRWTVQSDIPSVPPNLPIYGVGTYKVGGEVAVQQRMRADLRVGDEDSARFDSGLVIGGNGFPEVIDITISRNGMVCFDTVIHVAAKRQNTAAVCGGIAGIPCPAVEFCKYEIGRCCCDFQGVCLPIPGACITLWDPVCGCDGLTYGNECEADRAGVAIDHRGECRAPCDPTTGIGCVKVIIDMDPNTPGFQSSITVGPGSRIIHGIGVYIYDPNGHAIWDIGYLGGLDRGISFGYSPSSTNPQGRIAGLVANPGSPVNPGNTPMLIQPPMDKGFSGAEVQYVEYGAIQPALISGDPSQPIFTVDVILQNCGVGDKFSFQVMDFVRVWSGGSGGAFSTQGPMSLDTGGDVVPDGTMSIYGMDADAAIPIPPAAFYVDFVDGGPSQTGSPSGGATITVIASMGPIPAVTTWGVVVMIGLILSAGTIVLRRARRLA